MKYIEIRRHSVRGRGAHLNGEGVTLARKVGGETKQCISHVITSPLERAFETAIAMGYAVDEQLEILSPMDETAGSEVYWDSPYHKFVEKMLPGTALEALGTKLKKLMDEIIKTISDDRRALIITHGGIVQVIAAACLAGRDPGRLGEAPSYCEGIELQYSENNSIYDFKRLDA